MMATPLSLPGVVDAGHRLKVCVALIGVLGLLYLEPRRQRGREIYEHVD